MKLTRGQALDVSEIDHDLLKLFLPQIQSMFQYFTHTSFGSINVNAIPSNRYDTSSLMNDYDYYASENDQRPDQIIMENNRNIQQQHEFYNPYSKFMTNTVMYCLKGIMIYCTLIRNDIATPGMSEMKMTFKPPSSSSSSLSRAVQQKIKNHKHKLVRYLFLSTFLPLIHELMKWKQSIYNDQIDNLINHQEPNHNNDRTGRRQGQQERRRHDHHQRYLFKRSIQRKLFLLNYILNLTSFIIPPLQLYAFVNHLWKNGASPTISMISSDLQYDSIPNTLSSNQRSINFTYAQRRLWYEEMIITVGTVVPLEIWKDLPKAIEGCYSR